MAQNFFKTLANLEGDILGSNEDRFGIDRVDVLKKLCSFVSSGYITNSVAEQFICKNFRNDYKGITELWNAVGSNRKKGANTFRSQISTLSSKFYSLLKVSDDELNRAFRQTGYDEKFEFIKKFMSLYYLDDLSLDSRFSFSLHEYLMGYDYENEYPLDECKDEIALLRFMDSSNLLSVFEACDKDKLAYLLSRMRAPLIYKDAIREKEYTMNGKEYKRNVYKIEVNEAKLDFYADYIHVRPLQVSADVKPITVDNPISDSVDEKGTNRAIDGVSSKEVSKDPLVSSDTDSSVPVSSEVEETSVFTPKMVVNGFLCKDSETVHYIMDVISTKKNTFAKYKTSSVYINMLVEALSIKDEAGLMAFIDKYKSSNDMESVACGESVLYRLVYEQMK